MDSSSINWSEALPVAMNLENETRTLLVECETIVSVVEEASSISQLSSESLKYLLHIRYEDSKDYECLFTSDAFSKLHFSGRFFDFPANFRHFLQKVCANSNLFVSTPQLSFDSDEELSFVVMERCNSAYGAYLDLPPRPIFGPIRFIKVAPGIQTKYLLQRLNDIRNEAKEIEVAICTLNGESSSDSVQPMPAWLQGCNASLLHNSFISALKEDNGAPVDLPIDSAAALPIEQTLPDVGVAYKNCSTLTDADFANDSIASIFGVLQTAAAESTHDGTFNTLAGDCFSKRTLSSDDVESDGKRQKHGILSSGTVALRNSVNCVEVSCVVCHQNVANSKRHKESHIAERHPSQFRCLHCFSVNMDRSKLIDSCGITHAGIASRPAEVLLEKDLLLDLFFGDNVNAFGASFDPITGELVSVDENIRRFNQSCGIAGFTSPQTAAANVSNDIDARAETRNSHSAALADAFEIVSDDRLASLQRNSAGSSDSVDVHFAVSDAPIDYSSRRGSLKKDKYVASTSSSVSASYPTWLNNFQADGMRSAYCNAGEFSDFMNSTSSPPNPTQAAALTPHRTSGDLGNLFCYDESPELGFLNRPIVGIPSASHNCLHEFSSLSSLYQQHANAASTLTLPYSFGANNCSAQPVYASSNLARHARLANANIASQSPQLQSVPVLSFPFGQFIPTQQSSYPTYYGSSAFPSLPPTNAGGFADFPQLTQVPSIYQQAFYSTPPRLLRAPPSEHRFEQSAMSYPYGQHIPSNSAAVPPFFALQRRQQPSAMSPVDSLRQRLNVATVGRRYSGDSGCSSGGGAFGANCPTPHSARSSNLSQPTFDFSPTPAPVLIARNAGLTCRLCAETVDSMHEKHVLFHLHDMGLSRYRLTCCGFCHFDRQSMRQHVNKSCNPACRNHHEARLKDRSIQLAEVVTIVHQQCFGSLKLKKSATKPAPIKNAHYGNEPVPEDKSDDAFLLPGSSELLLVEQIKAAGGTSAGLLRTAACTSPGADRKMASQTIDSSRFSHTNAKADERRLSANSKATALSSSARQSCALHRTTDAALSISASTTVVPSASASFPHHRKSAASSSHHGALALQLASLEHQFAGESRNAAATQPPLYSALQLDEMMRSQINAGQPGLIAENRLDRLVDNVVESVARSQDGDSKDCQNDINFNSMSDLNPVQSDVTLRNATVSVIIKQETPLDLFGIE